MLTANPNRLRTNTPLAFTPNENESTFEALETYNDALKWDRGYRQELYERIATQLSRLASEIPNIDQRQWNAGETKRRNVIMTFCANQAEGSKLTWRAGKKIMREPRRPSTGTNEKQRDDARQAWNMHQLLTTLSGVRRRRTPPEPWQGATPTQAAERIPGQVEHLQQIHGTLMCECEAGGIHPGEWRPSHSSIGSPQYVFALPENIDFLTRRTYELAMTMPTPTTAAIMLDLGLILTHPFGDGNGRTTRIVTNELVARDGIAEVLHTNQTRRMFVTERARTERTGQIESLAQAWIDAMEWTNQLPWGSEKELVKELTGTQHMSTKGDIAQELDLMAAAEKKAVLDSADDYDIHNVMAGRPTKQ